MKLPLANGFQLFYSELLKSEKGYLEQSNSSFVILAAKIFPVVKNQHLLLCTLLIGNSLAMEVRT